MSRQTGSQRGRKRDNNAWIARIVLITFALAFGMSAVAESIQNSVPMPVALLVLFLFIGLGVFFDIIGIAIASAEEKPFVAMSAKKVRGAGCSLALLKKADRMSNLCNDVAGDVCGIVSGAMGAYVAIRIAAAAAPESRLLIAIAVSGVIASLTVGGKAVGKKIALTRRREIVHAAGRCISLFVKRE